MNNFVAKNLYDKVCLLAKDKIVVNAYSGQGELSRLLAEKAKFVYGIEVQTSAHMHAEQIKTSNMQNICGKVEDKLGEIDKNVDLIVLDPARAGCKASVLDEIINRKIHKVCYVSCNFSTLLRDIAVLQKNYDIKSVEIFDMFPMTAGLETLVIMQQRGS